MRTKIGIIYEKETCRLRRIVVPDEDWQLGAHSYSGAEETCIIEFYDGEVGPIQSESFYALIQFANAIIRLHSYIL